MTVAVAGEVDVCVARNRGRLLVNLVNTSGPHRTEAIIESIPPAGPFAVTLRTDKPPDLVTIAPSGAVPEHSWKEGTLTVDVPAVAVHDIVVIEP